MTTEDVQPFRWLKDFAPEFFMNGDNIEVITSPNKFFSVINDEIRCAKKRISISSLYLGTQTLEQQLVSSMHYALGRSKEGGLQIKILLDFTRGSRGSSNSRSMLLPLLQQYSASVQVALYHTPDLRGFMKQFLPARFNETFGVAHMKIYIIDDTVIISGANLSNDYFTNRQDRYILFRDKTFASFFDDLIATVSTFSFQLQSDDTVTLNPDWKIHPYNGDREHFKREAGKRIYDLLMNWKCHLGASNNMLQMTRKSLDSRVYPLIQMGPLGVTYDSDVTERIFKTAQDFTRIHLASGYFNLTGRYIDMILNLSSAKYNILTAAPIANGFFTARGIAGSIPKAYSYIASLFYGKILWRNQQSRILLFEYEKPQWTFHAKGLWYYFPNSTLPVMTLVGSPNFGHRSVHLDLESQVAIVTANNRLQQQLHLEQARLFSSSLPVSSYTFSTADRYVPLWVRWFARAFKKFF